MSHDQSGIHEKSRLDPIDRRTSLSEQDVVAIYLSQEDPYFLQKRFSVSRQTIWRIQNGLRYQHITMSLASHKSWEVKLNAQDRKVRRAYAKYEEEVAIHKRLQELRDQDPHGYGPTEEREYNERKTAERTQSQSREKQQSDVMSIRPPSITPDPEDLLPEEVGWSRD